MTAVLNNPAFYVNPPRTGNPIQDYHVRASEFTDVPDNLKMWQADVHGPLAVLAEVRRMFDGANPFSVAVTDHPMNGGRIHNIVRVGLGRVDGKKCARYCGENGDPDGAGSHSVIASWYPECTDPAAVACQLIAALGSGCIFILREV